MDYDIGANGIAYSDNIYEDTDKFGSNSESWNNGWVYRNDGVDIEYSTDQGGYNIGWTDNGEWLKYTVNTEMSGEYEFSFNASSPHDNGQIIVTIQEQTGSTNFQVPNTGGYQNWDWTDTSSVNLTSGENVIRVQIVNGNINLKSIKIEGSNLDPVPDNYSIWNYPNPFNGKTTVYFSNRIESEAVLRIFDINGKLVQRITVQTDASDIGWDGKDLAGLDAGSGIYFFQINRGKKTHSGKMTLIR